MNFGCKLSDLIATSYRYHFSHHLRNDFSLMHFLSCHFTAAATDVKSPTINLAELQGTFYGHKGSLSNENVIDHLKICSNLRHLESIYACIVKNSYNQDCFMINQFVSACYAFYRIDYAIQAFSQMDDPNVFVYNAVIRACVCCSSPIQALGFYLQMLSAQIAPTSYTFSSVIKGCALVAQSRIGEAINGHIWKKMPQKDLISWTTMINCYSQNKLYQKALATLDDMTDQSIIPDEITMATVISACAHLGALDIGKKIHFYLKKHCFNFDVYIGSSLIDMYAKCGSLDQSLVVFYKLPEKNLFCWNSVIEGLAAHGYANEALRMFTRMVKDGIKPNGVSFISVLSACTHAGMVNEGQSWFLSMIHDFHIPPEIEHYGCMVDLLCKAGVLEDALQVIKEMRMEPNAVIWGALLGGCKLHKNLEIAMIAVDKLMILEPDNSGYYTLLVNMFAEANRWSEVARMRVTMKDLRVEKKIPGSSWIEINGKIHRFSASDKYHESCKEIYLLLDRLSEWLRTRVDGYAIGLLEYSRLFVPTKKDMLHSDTTCKDP
ncbi:hypothetical protein E3N88_01054 [Mikania micrantha]|uniref:Pentatricopeptide repeat-containing protein n=1 Tax=Mikania micrantha TaxID=192012 RepID=A0A5N6Q284_9ASTR|nr:hypothetical protein E3N88_01054 [Mikania micrantha]